MFPTFFLKIFKAWTYYCNRPYFATFIRLLKFLSFLIAVLFPGIYVALGQFNPEAFPSAILYRIVDAQLTTPFSLMVEAIVIHVIFEILREAGLRLPRPVGHAISIVGALVIGESAVSAGLIGSPMADGGGYHHGELFRRAELVQSCGADRALSLSLRAV